MKLFNLLFVLLIACGGCSRRSVTAPTVSTGSVSESPEVETTRLRQKLKTITVTDGISNSEAELIAECYFHQKVGCGAFTGIQDGGEFWIIDVKFGLAGTPVKGFYIDKRTGKITSPIGPSYASPFDIFP